MDRDGWLGKLKLPGNDADVEDTTVFISHGSEIGFGGNVGNGIGVPDS